MSSATDILFEPLEISKPVDERNKYQSMYDAVLHALDGLQSFSFSVEPNVPLEVYNRIADLVENDQHQINRVKKIVVHDPNHIYRPSNALSIRDAFQRIKNGEYRFWYTGRLGQRIVKQFELGNHFTIDNRLVMLRLRNQPPGGTYYEWWIASMISNFTGYAQHYSFGSEDEANKYHTHNP